MGDPHGEGAEIVEGGNPDFAGFHGLDDAREQAQPDAVAQFGVLEAEGPDFIQHLAAAGMASGVPAGGEGVHGNAKIAESGNIPKGPRCEGLET
jgi:hypothetical protein